MSFTIPNSADVPQTAQYGNGAMAQIYSSDLAITMAALRGDGVQKGTCQLVAGTNAGTVKVNLGTWFADGVQADVAAQDNVACVSNADATNPKWILYELDTSQVLQANVGTAAASPVPPTPTSGRAVVGAVFVPANATAVDTLLSTANGNAKIIDKRADKAMIDVRYYSGHGTSTWSKPANARLLDVWVIGAGNGGAGGRCGAAASVRGGGGGGGNGGVKRRHLYAADVGSTETVTVGQGGAGGGGGASGGADGTNGSNGGASSFGAHVVVSQLTSFLVASAGTNAPGGAGGVGNTDSEILTSVNVAAFNTVVFATGNVGGATASGASGGTGGSGASVPGAGGAGGAVDGSNNRRNGGPGGVGDPAATITGGTAGTGSNGAGGGNGTATTLKHQLGAGGGGGSGSTASATSGGNGGNGSAPGGGGGGGGGGTTGGVGTGGTGGNGADGAVLVISYP